MSFVSRDACVMYSGGNNLNRYEFKNSQICYTVQADY